MFHVMVGVTCKKSSPYITIFGPNLSQIAALTSFCFCLYRYYGCGLVIPAKVEGMKILDLGSGSGRDCFALSKLVGKDGFVTGIDMTDEQVL